MNKTVEKLRSAKALVANFKGDKDLLRKFCAGRASVRSGYFAAKQEDLGRIHYSPRLAGLNVCIDSSHIYDTRESALDAARRYKASCKKYAAAFDLIDRAIADAEQSEVQDA